MGESSRNFEAAVDFDDPVEQSIGRLKIDGWLVEPDTGQVRREGRSVRLEPKVMDVLVYLARHAGQVVSRTELEDEVWKGTVVSYDAVTGSIQKLRKVLGDNARHPRVIETFSKRGYRLIAQVSTVDEQPANLTDTLASKPTQWQWLSARRLTFWSVLLLVVALMWWVYPWEAGNNDLLVESTPRSIVVLPFENLGTDPEQDYFVNGITEDIITDLSRFPDLTVVARDVAFSDASDEVRYALQGAVRKSGDKLRITVQLIDTASGNHVWAERYDRKLVEIFALQDELTQSIVTALAIELTAEEKRLLADPVVHNFEAYDSFLQGQQFLKMRTKEGNRLARDAYMQAIDLDPAYARAYGALAVVLTHDFRQGWTEAPVETLEQALVLARKAVALDRNSPQAHWALGFVYLYRKQFSEAVGAVERAIAMAPNYADGYGLLAFISTFRGEPEEAIAYIRRGIELNPYYTYEYSFALARAYHDLGRYAEAVETLTEVVERNANVSFPRLYLAASYVGLGLQDEAEWEIEEVRLLNPNTTVSHIRNTLPFDNRGQLEDFIEDLRQAGLPE